MEDAEAGAEVSQNVVRAEPVLVSSDGAELTKLRAPPTALRLRRRHDARIGKDAQESVESNGVAAELFDARLYPAVGTDVGFYALPQSATTPAAYSAASSLTERLTTLQRRRK
jgi:hypothetical protein